MPTLNLDCRICAYGPSSSGKTMAGRLLADHLGVPFVELDAIYHCRPDWQDLSDEEFREVVAGRLDPPRRILPTATPREAPPCLEPFSTSWTDTSRPSPTIGRKH